MWVNYRTWREENQIDKLQVYMEFICSFIIFYILFVPKKKIWMYMTLLLLRYFKAFKMDLQPW